MIKLSEQENALFDEWRHRLGNDAQSFVPDGAVCGETFESTSTRIVFLLKEMNDPGGGNWDLREFLRSGGQGATWNNVTRWTRSILALPNLLPWEDLEDVDENARIEALKRIAAVNPQKVPGGATAYVDELHNFVYRNCEFLRRQLELYRPNLIVGCGGAVAEVLFREVYPKPEWRQSVQGIRYAEIERATYLDYYHPNARISKKLLHDWLIESLRDLSTGWVADNSYRSGDR